jgi:hypothetical protein
MREPRAQSLTAEEEGRPAKVDAEDGKWKLSITDP